MTEGPLPGKACSTALLKKPHCGEAGARAGEGMDSLLVTLTSLQQDQQREDSPGLTVSEGSAHLSGESVRKGVASPQLGPSSFPNLYLESFPPWHDVAHIHGGSSSVNPRETTSQIHLEMNMPCPSPRHF